MAVVAALLFSVNATASKTVLLAGLTPVQLVSLRSAGAAVCLFVLLAITRPASLRATPRELAFFALFGVTGIAFVQWFYFVAIARLPVSIALLLEYTAPVLVALWVRFVHGETVRTRVWGALLLCLGGLALVAQVHNGLTLDGLGVLAGFGAAVSLAAYYLLGARGLGERDALSLCAWSFAFSALLWAVIQPWWTFPFGTLGLSTALSGVLAGVIVPVGLVVAGIVVLGTVVPFLLVLGAIRHLGPHRVGLLGMAEPVGAGLVAWFLLREVLSPLQLAGAALVLVGILLAETARKHQPGESTAPLPDGFAP